MQHSNTWQLTNQAMQNKEFEFERKFLIFRN